MNHLMVDLETMGNKPNAPIISIGAAFFEPSSGEIGSQFSCSISLDSSMSVGAHPDASTIMWWMKQSEAARESVAIPDSDLPSALLGFSDFVTSNSKTKFVQIWGNGATFDCVILRNSFSLCGLPTPWEWWNDRDVRTIVELGRVIGFDPKKDMPFDGIRHNALADAIHQAKYVSSIWQKLTA